MKIYFLRHAESLFNTGESDAKNVGCRHMVLNKLICYMDFIIKLLYHL